VTFPSAHLTVKDETHPRRKLRIGTATGIIILVAAALGPTAARAQDTTRARHDSLVTALKDLQARLDALEHQVAEGTENGVHTRSGIRMELTGRVLVQAFGNTRRVNNVDNPQFVRPDTSDLVPVRGGGMSMRQSLIAFRVTSPDVAGAQFSGDVQTDFNGGQQPSSGGRTFPLIRLRVARATLRWSKSELMVGQEVPLIAQVNPVSIAASGTPEFAGAGNLWLWLPQARITLGGMAPNTAAIQLAVLAPTNGDPAAPFDTDLDPAERSQRPFFQGRLRYRWETSERQGELGCGAHVGWIALSGAPPSGRPLTPSQAVACDIVAPWKIFEVRGEAYSGRALRGLGGGGIGQSIGPTNTAVHDVGRWGQLNIAPSSIWSFGAGAGLDDPRDSDIAPAGRQRNASMSGYFITHPSGPLVLGVEFRRIATTYGGRILSNDHLNLAFGFEF
jgi:hypothetical protein